MSESYEQHPEQGERGNDGVRESCGDDRFELIDKAKVRLLEATNIEMRPDEMAVIDSILFRCWQMGWLDQLRYENTRWHELLGSPEKAARMIANACTYHGSFDCSFGCLADEAHCGCGDYDTLLEWLRSEDEVIDEPDTISNELMGSGLLRVDAE